MVLQTLIVSDAVQDAFLSLVFLELHPILFLFRTPLSMGERPERKTIGHKMTVLHTFSRGKKVPKLKPKVIFCFCFQSSASLELDARQSKA